MIKSNYIILLCLVSIPREEARSVKRKGTPSPLRKDLESWHGKWFPYAPNESPPEENELPAETFDTPIQECDNEMKIAIDYDPDDKRHSYNYLCLNNRTLFYPNLQTEAVFSEHFIPPAYVPPVKCLNESINYSEKLPTFGPFRLLPPKYGSYKYLPPQRWLHSLAEGAIVMLYHPCANKAQVRLLEHTLQGCLYRHIITPSQTLSPDRPMALLAWGKMLTMSVMDQRMVVSFIKQNAKQGPITPSNVIKDNTGLYETDLLLESHLVTDITDIEICGYNEM